LAEIPRLDHAADAEGARGAALAGMSAPADGGVARHFGQGRGEHAIPHFPEPAGSLGPAMPHHRQRPTGSKFGFVRKGFYVSLEHAGTGLGFARTNLFALLMALFGFIGVLIRSGSDAIACRAL
jgi:hypothetical protein